MELVLKAAALGTAASVLALAVKKSNAESALMLTVAASVVMLAFSLGAASAYRDTLDRLFSAVPLGETAITPVVKCVGIGIAAKLGSDICHDAGADSVAGSVEIAGAVCALMTALPLMTALLEMVGELI